MKKFTVLALLLIPAVYPPAFAQADEFYVVRDTTTKKCTIVDKRPSSSVLAIERVYRTRIEAEAGMKSVIVCEKSTIQPTIEPRTPWDCQKPPC